MDVKKLTRNPIVYVLLIGMLLVLGVAHHVAHRREADHDAGGPDAPEGDTVTKVTNTDGDQRVDLTLSKPFEGSTKVQFYYVGARGRSGLGDRQREAQGRLQRRRPAHDLLRA
jgi:cell division protease FtsH